MPVETTVTWDSENRNTAVLSNGVEGEINRGSPQDPYSSVKVVVTVWDTLQRKTGELHAGDNKGKKCKCASGSDIENCLKAFAGNYSGKWSLLRS